MCKNSFSVVIRAIDNTLLLMFLQYTRNDCLSNNTDATIIHHSCPKCVEPFNVDISIGLQQSNIIIFVLMGWTWKGLDKFDKGKEEKQSPLDQIMTFNGTNFKSTLSLPALPSGHRGQPHEQQCCPLVGGSAQICQSPG